MLLQHRPPFSMVLHLQMNQRLDSPLIVRVIFNPQCCSSKTVKSEIQSKNHLPPLNTYTSTIHLIFSIKIFNKVSKLNSKFSLLTYLCHICCVSVATIDNHVNHEKPVPPSECRPNRLSLRKSDIVFTHLTESTPSIVKLLYDPRFFFFL